MASYVILFRAINVGGRNRLPMQDLVKLLQKQGFTQVKTYIQSGNVVFNSPNKPTASLGTAIEKQFGFKPDIIVLTAKEFKTAIAQNPFATDEGKTLHFYFCKAKPTLDKKRFEQFKTKREQYHLRGKVFYLLAPDGIGKSKLVGNIESCLGVAATGRNFNTINKIAEILSA